MEIIKEFVVTLVSTLVLITAVEMILPDNSMKKYCKFILGAMLIGVILNPILKFVNHGEIEIVDKITNFSIDRESTEKNNEEARKLREESFKKNFSRNINNILKNKFNKYKFSNKLTCNINFKTMEIGVEKVIVYVEEQGIKRIKKIDKIDILEKEKKEKTNSKYDEIRSFLAEELKIGEEKIIVVEGGA